MAHDSARPIPPGHVLLGVVGRPHGVRGLVRVQSYTADPADLARYAPLLDDQGRCWSLRWRGTGVAELRDAANVPLPDRNAAERLVNTRLMVARAAMPAPGDDEFYLTDLIGLRALDGAGREAGTVSAVHDYGGGASLEIARPGAGPLLLPFTRACVPEIDAPAGTLWIVPPVEVEAPTPVPPEPSESDIPPE